MVTFSLAVIQPELGLLLIWQSLQKLQRDFCTAAFPKFDGENRRRVRMVHSYNRARFAFMHTIDDAHRIPVCECCHISHGNSLVRVLGVSSPTFPEHQN